MQIEGVGAIVTGGASGLGAATARALAARGAAVAIFDINGKSGNEVAREIGGAAFDCDVADGTAVADAVDAAHARHGVARILVNCAGIDHPGRTVGKHGPLELDAFERVIRTNLIGTFNVIRLFAGKLNAAEKLGDEAGVIVNTASVAAFDGQIGQAAYSASKGGIVAMTLPIARDLSRSAIRINTIAPGLFLTPMNQGLPEELRQSLASQVPFPKRWGDPSEYAAMVLHLIENPMVNGECIRLDGALRMGMK